VFEAFIDPAATACNPTANTAQIYAPGDMGSDGAVTGNPLVARDAFGFSLNYYTADYAAINTTVTPFATGMHNLPGAPSDGIGSAAQLFNGNIASMMVSLLALSTAAGSGDGRGQMVYGYGYDR